MELVAISSQRRTLATPHVIVVKARAEATARAGTPPTGSGNIGPRATGTAASSSSSID